MLRAAHLIIGGSRLMVRRSTSLVRNTIPQLNETITALETDKDVKVVVFDSAVEGFFLTHYDFLAKPEDTTGLPPGPTGVQAEQRQSSLRARHDPNYLANHRG